jgi:trehalose 6-phosphate synthase
MSPAANHPTFTQATFVVVANRLPVDRVEQPGGSSEWRPSPGGLVTALEPIMHRHAGAWVGWPGAPDEDHEPFVHDGLQLVPVPLSTDEVTEYYEGFSNGSLWPLYHDVIATPEFHREWWDTYVLVNQRFADRTADVASQGATVWVQDYQLQLVPQMLRERRPDLRIGFFLHIPFPPTELFLQLPWRDQVLHGLLGADLVGFQLPGGAQNFVRLVRRRLGLETKKDRINLPDGRRVLARSYPIAIDAKGLNELAGTPEAAARAAEIRRELGNPRQIFLGVDRLDYTKGLLERIRAFGELLAEGKIDADETALLQLAVPSRERVDQYRQLRDDTDRLVGRINGNAGRIGRPPITYLHTSYPREEMAALYRAADIMVVTPLRDGMNLVAKEYVACRQADDGALVLSEFAGAARELRQAYLVNPHDINGLKDRMVEAMEDSPQAKARRMRLMRRQVFENDIDRWASTFLADLEAVRGS